MAKRGRKPLQRLRVYEFICVYKEENDGLSPTYEDICMNFGWSSMNNAWTHVQGLERDGLIRFDKKYRIQVIDGEYISPNS